jgi:hypothetical protein
VYLLPKIHKPVLAGRMICPSHSWITTRVSTWLAAELNDTAKLQPTVLQDSRELIRDLDTLLVPRDCLLATFDVVNLYPNIEHASAQVHIASFFPDNATKQACIKDFLDFVMLNNYFTFRGKLYHQVHGTAMGTSVAPPYANLYLARLELNVIAASRVQPLYYKRFIDDGFVIWPGTRADLDAFLELWNTQHPNIKITADVSDSSVHYLDLNITKDLATPGQVVPLVITTYEKPMNKYLYIPFSSFHNPCVFKGFIKSRMISFMVSNSRFEDFCAIRAKFVDRLLRRGYPSDFLITMCDSVSYSDRQHYLHNKSPKLGDPILHNKSPKRGESSVPFFTDYTVFSAGFANWRNVFKRVYFMHEQSPDVKQVVPDVPMVVYFRGQNLHSKLVRADH